MDHSMAHMFQQERAVHSADRVYYFSKHADTPRALLICKRYQLNAQSCPIKIVVAYCTTSAAKIATIAAVAAATPGLHCDIVRRT